MKILLLCMQNSYTESLAYELRKLTNEVHPYFLETFLSSLTWIKRKKHFWGVDNHIYDNFITEQNYLIQNYYDQIKPDVVIVFNYDYLSSNTLNYINKKSKTIIWLIDSLKEKTFYDKIFPTLPFYNLICTYEKDDAIKLRKKLNRNILFFPLGFDSRYYEKTQERIKNIDISFVGSRSQSRLILLEKVAQYIYNNNLKMIVYGITADNNARHFWKKHLEKKRFFQEYPYLSKYLANQLYLPPKQTALIYEKSRIVLNINRTTSCAINPRTFEIMATGTFELMDKRSDYCELITPGIDLAIYNDGNDLVNKIDYYLHNEFKRELIANAGYNKCNKFSMTNCAKNLFNTIANIL